MNEWRCFRPLCAVENSSRNCISLQTNRARDPHAPHLRHTRQTTYDTSQTTRTHRIWTMKNKRKNQRDQEVSLRLIFSKNITKTEVSQSRPRWQSSHAKLLRTLNGLLQNWWYNGPPILPVPPTPGASQYIECTSWNISLSADTYTNNEIVT